MPGWACAQSSGIAGVIHDTQGKPQPGATVEVFSLGAGAFTAVQTVLTDQRGKYALANLLPGEYFVRVSAPAFLPAVREHISLAANSRVVVNLTLNTIFRAEQMLPAKRTAQDAGDDWKWTLRSSSNRPVLRVVDAQEELPESDGPVAHLAVTAGGGFDGLGGMPSVATDFDVTQGLNSGQLAFKGNVGYGGRDPDGSLRVSFAPKSRDGAPQTEIAFLVRRASVDSPRLVNSAVNTYGLSFSESTRLLDLVDLRYGARLENASVIGKQVYVEPLLDAAVSVGKDGRLFYRQGWSDSSGDDPAIGPRLSYTDHGIAMERGLHQETGYEHRVNGHHFGVAYYRDVVSNLALLGIGQMDYAGPDLNDGILAGSDLESFTANVGRVHTQGIKVRWERQFTPALKASARAAYGTVVDGNAANPELAALRAGLGTEYRPSIGGDVVVKVRSSELESSYNVTIGSALTPVDMSDARSTATAPYWNVRIRQPLPSFLPAHIDAVIDIRNLMAQGYRPVMGQDGRTLYLVQAARSLRGGLAFTF